MRRLGDLNRTVKLFSMLLKLASTARSKFTENC